MRSWLFLVGVLFAVAASRAAAQAPSGLGNYTPGSYINLFTSTATSTTLTYIVLSDGATGANYTTLLGKNISTALQMIVYPEDRLVTFQIGYSSSVSGFLFYEYAPRTAPWPSAKYVSCVLPAYSGLSQPFLLNGNVYASMGTSIFKIQLPAKAGGQCQSTANSVIQHNMFSAMSFARAERNLLTFITRTAVAQLSASDEGTVFETFAANHSLNRQPPAYYMVDTDWSTSKIYITIQNNYPSKQTAFVATIATSTSLTLEPLAEWTSTITDNALYSVDYRYAVEVGPLLCGVDFFGQHCNLPANGTDVVWQGPGLPSLGGGYGTETVYDFLCQ